MNPTDSLLADIQAAQLSAATTQQFARARDAIYWLEFGLATDLESSRDNQWILSITNRITADIEKAEMLILEQLGDLDSDVIAEAAADIAARNLEAFENRPIEEPHHDSDWVEFLNTNRE